MRIVGIIALVFLIFPSFAYASVVNINTADATTLESLFDIGTKKATAIITYRKNHGVFESTEAIQNVSGIGKNIYEKIKAFITVGSVNMASPDNTRISDVPSSTLVSSTSTKKTEIYIPQSSGISIKIHSTQGALLEVPMTLSAQVLAKKGTTDLFTQIVWGFGDGSSAVGSLVTKTYHYAGTYLITATAKDGTTIAYGDMIAHVAKASVHIRDVSYKGVTIENNSDERLNLSGWWILSGTGRFRIPSGTVILPRALVLFPFSIMNIPISFSATLTYPDGIFASSYTPEKSVQLTKLQLTKKVPMPVATPSRALQLVAVKKRSNKRQVVAIINHKKNIHLNAKESYAPTDAKNLASVGAVLPSVASPSFASTSLPKDTRKTPAKSSSGIFHSVWTTGLLGVIILAGSAFILL